MAAAAVGTVIAAQVWAEEEIVQVIGMLVHTQADIAPLAAVTAIGTAMGDVFFPAKTCGAISAIASLGINSNMIYKHRPSLEGEMPECKVMNPPHGQTLLMAGERAPSLMATSPLAAAIARAGDR